MSIPDKKTLQLKLGAALRRLREDRGLREIDVAERMGKKPGSSALISRWERGESAPIATQLWGYLTAIEASFADLDRELNPRPKTNRRLAEIARELKELAPGSIEPPRHCRALELFSRRTRAIGTGEFEPTPELTN